MSSLTNERLRYWLTTNQAARERLCAGLLPVLGEYSDVLPRRPEGGPDGGRDLDAVYRGGTIAAIAIGFRNNVRDDEEDKKWVRSKAIADSKSAKSKTRATRFVFITNIDLTPSETTDITKLIYDAGFSSCDVIYRERLRLALDSPEGFALRATHLQIPLDVAEQATFFARFAEGVNKSSSSEIFARLSRLELQSERDAKIRDIQIDITTAGKKWWQLLVGQPLVVSVMSTRFDEDQFAKSFHIVFRRPPRKGKRNLAGEWVGVVARTIEWNDAGKKSHSDGTSIGVFSQREDHLSLYFPSAAIWDLAESVGLLGNIDRTHWMFSMSDLLARSVSKIDLVADTWILARVQRAQDGTQGAGIRREKIDVSDWPPSIHFREQHANLAVYGSAQIDFRRVRPSRVWDDPIH